MFSVQCSEFGVRCSVLDGLPAHGEVSFVAGGPALLSAPDGSGRAEPGVEWRGGFGCASPVEPRYTFSMCSLCVVYVWII